MIKTLHRTMHILWATNQAEHDLALKQVGVVVGERHQLHVGRERFRKSSKRWVPAKSQTQAR